MYTEPNNLRIKEGPIDDDFNYDLNVLNEDMIDGSCSCLQPCGDEPKKSPKSYIPVSGSKPGGGHFIASLFMGINSFEIEKKKSKLSLEKQKAFKINHEYDYKQADEDFVAFAMISEATMIDVRLSEPISFRLGFGLISLF